MKKFLFAAVLVLGGFAVSAADKKIVLIAGKPSLIQFALCPAG